MEHIAPTIERTFGLFNSALALETNHQGIADAAAASFGRFALIADDHPLRVRVLVDSGRNEPWGEGRIGFHASAGLFLIDAPGTVAVADLGAARAVAIVGRGMLDDLRIVRREILEALALAMVTYSRGYFSVHAAGVARNGLGVAVMAAAGGGKSTLTVAAARRGLDVFAEDAVFVRATSAGIDFWGMPWIQRLLPSSLDFFPELVSIPMRIQANGETKLETNLDDWFPGHTTPRAHPAALVRLERRPGTTSVELLVGDDGRPFEVRWPWPDGWSAAHQLAAERLSDLPMYRLVMGGSPDVAADCLGELLDELAVRSPAR